MKTNYPKMHVSLYVKNIEDTTRFYESFFNQKAAKIENKYVKFTLEEPALIISFIENENKIQSSFGHLGIQVDSVEELKLRLEKAKAQKLVELEEIGTSCCYALQDKFWVRDPDGYAWEVYFFHQDVKFNDPHYSLEEKEACCTPASESKETQCC
jgi:catechol 2,3-dioxygenase-like lactoylglutathione lyase family enzyme